MGRTFQQFNKTCLTITPPNTCNGQIFSLIIWIFPYHRTSCDRSWLEIRIDTLEYCLECLWDLKKYLPRAKCEGDIEFMNCVSGALLVSDSRLVCCRPRAMHRRFLLLSSLVTFHKNIFSTFRTTTCMLQCTPKATIYGRRLVLLPEDCDLRLHRNPAMEM